MLTTATRDHLVCVWSLKSSIAQCIQFLSVCDDFKSSKPKQGKIEAAQTSEVIKSVVNTEPIFKKITSLCWAKFPNNGGTHTILYTATCPIGYSPTIVYACNFDVATNATVSCFFFTVPLFTLLGVSVIISNPEYYIKDSRMLCYIQWNTFKPKL